MEEFSRTEALLGGAAMEKLAAARVAVFGLGGVGSYCAEALARAGVGALDLIDPDVVAPSNLNRQLYALHSTLGRHKADVAAERIADIAPACRVTVHKVFFLPEMEFDFSPYHFIVDAIDTVAGKIALAERAFVRQIPLISAMGAGNKLDPTRFRVSDLFETKVCPLARVMRRELKKRGISSLKVVYSEEEPAAVSTDVPGSVSFVPPVVGFILAGEVIKSLIT